MNKYQYMHLLAQLVKPFGGQPLKYFYGGLGHILMFHRVTPHSGKPRLFANSYLEVTPEYLDWTINYFKSHGYVFLSINELSNHLEKQNPEPFVIYTFDDGFKDNLHHAYPILKKHEIPFTIYITTDFPDKKAILWWNHLEDLVMNQESVKFTVNNIEHSFMALTSDQKTKAFKAIATIIKGGDAAKRNDRLTQIFKNTNINPFNGIQTLALSWDEIRQLHHDPLVTIGSHTVTHPTLSMLTDNDASDEINHAKNRLEEELSSKIEHFAYPFGGFTEIGSREVGIVKTAGITTAVTTFSANTFKAHASKLHTLPRIAIGMSMNKDTLDLIRYGIIPCIRNNGKRIVTI